MTSHKRLQALGGCTLILLAACAEREPLPQGPRADLAVTSGEVQQGNAGNAAVAHLSLTTSDPDQTYIGDDPDPWLRKSWVSTQSATTIRVTNDGASPARGVELLVAIPAGLPRSGWSVTVGDPGVVYTSPDEFPHFRLRDSRYPPVPHGVYLPEGNARYLIVPGPAELASGATWEVPLQLFRGVTAGFRVHLDVAARRHWCPPAEDVTLLPPEEQNRTGP